MGRLEEDETGSIFSDRTNQFPTNRPKLVPLNRDAATDRAVERGGRVQALHHQGALSPLYTDQKGRPRLGITRGTPSVSARTCMLKEEG